jgi:hypothetical protein
MNAMTSAILFFLVVANSWLSAGVVPGRWEKVEALMEGQAVTVKLESGEEIKAMYKDLTEVSILLDRGGEEELEIPKSAIVTVISQKRICDDSLGNGAIIGAAVGGGFALIAGFSLAGGDDTGYVAAIAALYAAMGMGVGAGVDSIVKGHEVYYQAPDRDQPEPESP